MTHEITKAETIRNYQLDFLKLVFTFFVIVVHTTDYVGPNTRIAFPPMLGPISVHFFFIVSGILMVNSIAKKKSAAEEPGKSAMHFVLNRFKNISWQYYTALFLFMCVFIYIYIYQGRTFQNISVALLRIFPELFLVVKSGILIEYNGPTWYISAMLLCMLPLAYMLYKRKDFTLYVFAPLTALFLLGYMCQTNDFMFFSVDEFYGLFLGGTMRAMCGLCFGIVAWTIYNRIIQWKINKNGKIFLTIAEFLLYFMFFAAWFYFKDRLSIISTQLILPIALAISFSGQSYISKLFNFKWMKWFGPVSLALYLNHWTGRKIAVVFFPDCSYKLGVSLMLVFTIATCVVYFAVIALCKWLWKNKLKKLFVERVEPDA